MASEIKGKTPKKTSKKHIGHVAPSFEDKDEFNSLVIRPEYRISIRLGDIDEICPSAADTKRGRMERLQVLGLFYFPLGHSRAETAFDGEGGATGTWAYFKDEIAGKKSDADADKEIKKRLKKWVVDGGKLPTAAPEGKDPKKKNLKKLRIPGGYTFMGDNTGRELNRDNAYPQVFTVDDIYAVEDLFWDDNDALGKIPLIAKVEKKDPEDKKWKPAKDAAVYFQLLEPYDLPDFETRTDVHKQLNRPPLRASTVGPPAQAAGAGPAALTNTEEARNPDPDDPQNGNCHEDRGGKRGEGSQDDGTDVAGHLFSTDEVCGFHKAYEAVDGNPVRAAVRKAEDAAEGPYFFPKAEASGSGDHKHAVKTKTNKEGEAGVIFTPSRCGGDRWRFRAYVGPDTIKGPGNDGKGMLGIRVDTGTLVLWRSMRVSRYVQQPAGSPHANLLAEVNNATYNITTSNAYLQQCSVVDGTGRNRGLAKGDFSGRGRENNDFDGVRRNWARAFVEVTVDPKAKLPETMKQADFLAARQLAMTDAAVGMGNLGMNLNLQVLYCMEAGNPIQVNSAVASIVMRTPDAYNAHASVANAQQITNAAGGAHASANANNTIANIETLTLDYLSAGFARYFSHHGFTPGLVVVQSAMGFTWQITGDCGDFSGIAQAYRACHLWYGAAAYVTALNAAGFPYGFSSNVCHEMGHISYREHAPGGGAGGANASRHDATPGSICVMSYRTCEGQFCARCLFGFRGWDEHQI